MFLHAKAGTERVEFKVRKVTRYIVTEWHSYETEGGGFGGSSMGGQGSASHGEFDSASKAYEVASALAAVKHKALGWSDGDPRITPPSDDLVAEERAYYDNLHAQQRAAQEAMMAAREAELAAQKG